MDQPLSLYGPAVIPARVESAADGDLWHLVTDTGPVTAHRAASCLVPPAPGARVLVGRHGADAFILAVLDPPEGPCPLTPVAGAGLAVRAPTVSVDADTATLRTGTARLVGRLLALVADRLHSVATHLDSISERSVHRTGTALKVVTGTDSTRAADIQTRAENTLSVQATDVLVTAGEDVRLDGERISMG